MSKEILLERIRLCAVALTDVKELYQSYVTDSTVTKFLLWKPHNSIAQTEQFVQRCTEMWQSEKAFPYVIRLNDKHDLIGMIEFSEVSRTVEVGYVLDKKHWGNGYMKEAVMAIVAKLEQLRVIRIQAYCDIENVASINVLIKCGFVCEGLLRKYSVRPNLSDSPRDSYIFSRI